jgi:hypothetical protein
MGLKFLNLQIKKQLGPLGWLTDEIVVATSITIDLVAPAYNILLE